MIIFPILLFALLGFLFQSFIVFSPDVGYLLYATKQWLAGGRYVTDIFETNPPMILYLYSPIWFAVKWFQIDIILLARIYMLILASVSAVICFQLLKKIISSKERIYFYGLFSAILCVLFILPLKAFLQREHLFLIVLLPYLLIVTARLCNQTIHPARAFGVGAIAAVGFALKPFFFITFVLIEGYVIFKKRHFFAWFRIETFVIMTVNFVYVVYFWLDQPGYFKEIVPLVFEYYYPVVKRAWTSILVLPTLLFCIAMMFSPLLVRQYNQYRTLGTVFVLALFGMTIAFLISRTPWYYHILPALALAVLLLLHIFLQTISDGKRVFLPLFITLCVLFYPGYECVKTYRTMLHFTKTHSMQKIAAYINSHPGDHSLYCLTTRSAAPCFPLVYQTNSIYAGRYPALWWYTGVRLAEKKSQKAHVLQVKNKLIDYLAEDLNRYQPKWLVVDEKSFNWMENKNFNIIASFSENIRFLNAFRQYSLVNYMDNYSLYERVG